MHVKEQAYTYKKLLADIQKISMLFKTHDLKHGARILIVTHQDNHAASLFISALLNGFCSIVISSEIKAIRLNMIIEQTTPQLVFIDESCEARMSMVGLSTMTIIPISCKKKYFLRRSDQAMFSTLLSHLPPLVPNLQCDQNTSSHILYTSGSTASPKGVEHTHGSLFSHMDTLTRVFSYNADSVIFNNIDLSHADGLLHGPLITAYTGATLIRSSPFSISKLTSQLNVLHRHKVTHFLTAPVILAWIDCFTQIDDYFSFPAFKYLISVAAKLDEALWYRLNKRFNLQICNMYGLTETVSGGIFCMPSSDGYQVGSVGFAHDIQVSVLENNTVHATGSGELLMKGASIFKGYYNNKQANEEAFYDDWFRTGDLAEINKTGRVKIIGRCKSTIISGGRNIEPDEVDEVLQQHPQIYASITLGRPDKMLGQCVVSVIETTNPLDEVSVIQYALEHLESYKVPKAIFCMNKLPRGKSGKILQDEVLNTLQSMDSQVSLNAGKKKVLPSDIIHIAASSFKLPSSQISIDTRSDTISLWDSLGHLTFMMAIEKAYGIKLDLRDVLSIDTIQDAIEIVQGKI